MGPKTPSTRSVHQRNLKIHKFHSENASLFKWFPFTLHLTNLKTQQSSVILDLYFILEETSLLSKTSKCFASTLKWKAYEKGDFGSELITRADDFVSKRLTSNRAASFFWNECKERRVRSQVMKGLALTSQVNFHGLIVFTAPIISLFFFSFFAFFPAPALAFSWFQPIFH